MQHFLFSIDDMLIRGHYLCEKSQKQCCDLEDVVIELKACLEPTDMPTGASPNAPDLSDL